MNLALQETDRAELDKCKEEFLLRSLDCSGGGDHGDADEGPDDQMPFQQEGGPTWIRQRTPPQPRSFWVPDFDVILNRSSNSHNY